MKQTLYLIVDVDKQEAWTVKRKPQPKFGQMYYRLNLDIPDAWYGPVGEIDLDLPEPPDNMVEVKKALGL